MLALREEIGQKEGEEERKEVQEVPLTINRNARVEEIDSRAIMDYLIFDRGFIEEGEEVKISALVRLVHRGTRPR